MEAEAPTKTEAIPPVLLSLLCDFYCIPYKRVDYDSTEGKFVGHMRNNVMLDAYIFCLFICLYFVCLFVNDVLYSLNHSHPAQKISRIYLTSLIRSTLQSQANTIMKNALPFPTKREYQSFPDDVHRKNCNNNDGR